MMKYGNFKTRGHSSEMDLLYMFPTFYMYATTERHCNKWQHPSP